MDLIDIFINTVRNLVEIMSVLFNFFVLNAYIIINHVLLISTTKIYSSKINYLVDQLLRSGAIRNTLRSKLSEIVSADKMAHSCVLTVVHSCVLI